MALIRLAPKDFVIQTPTYPDFPFAEYERRIKRAKELMSRHGADCLVLWKRENVRYYFGFQTTQWDIPSYQAGVGVIPLDGEPMLIIPDLLIMNAQHFCWTKDIRYQPKCHEVPNVRAFPQDVADAIKDIGCGNKRIALEMGYMGDMWIPRPLNDIETFKNALPDATFVDGDKIIWGCRLIKSALEVDRVKRAVAVTAKCHAAVIEQFRPGMTEMDVAKIIQRIQVETGDLQGSDTLISASICGTSAKEGVSDINALDDERPITRDDYLKLDLLHKHKGYFADICRVFQVVPLTDQMRRNYDLCLAGLDSAAAMVKPGAIASDIYAAAMKPIIDAGLAPVEMAGHGLGMDVHEPPFIDATDHTPLEEGMLLAIEVWIYKSLKRCGGEGVFGYEDQFWVTANGAERIEGFDKSIVQVAHPFE